MVAIIIATVSFAQSQIATLSHGDEIKTFYGPSGFKSAMDAATHGDIITLSRGQFTATDITKAVTLRGSGMVSYSDSIGYYAPTIINGSIKIQIDENIQNKLAIDGIMFANTVQYVCNLNNPLFTKCNFLYFGGTNDYTHIRNAIFINCRVSEKLDITDTSTATCINSVIGSP